MAESDEAVSISESQVVPPQCSATTVPGRAGKSVAQYCLGEVSRGKYERKRRKQICKKSN